MVGTDLNNDQLYSFYVKTVLPVINDHFAGRKRERFFLFFVSVGIFAGSVLIYSYWGVPHFIFLAIFLIIFIFVKDIRHVDLEYGSRIVSLMLKFINTDFSYNVKGSSRVEGAKNAGLYPQINFEDCSDIVSANISNIPITVSFVVAKKVKKLAVTRFSLGLILCIFFIFICVNFFEKLFPASLMNSYFGGGLGIFFTYWFLSELNDITLKGETVFQGLLITADFKKKFYGKTLVFSDPIGDEAALRMLSLSGLASVGFEDREFADNFSVFSSIPDEARNLLSPNVRRSFCLARRRFGLPVDFSFNRSLLFLAIRRDSFLDRSIFNDIDPFDKIVAFCGEVNLIFDTISGMSLDNSDNTEAL